MSGSIISKIPNPLPVACERFNSFIDGSKRECCRPRWDSPNELVASRGHQDYVAFLEEQVVRGFAESQKAIHDKVAKDIEERYAREE